MHEREEVVTTRTPADDFDRPPAASVDRVHATAYDPYARRRSNAAKLVQAVSLLFGIIEGLLLLRFILLLLGANPSAGFAAGLYAITAPFLAPFVGLFGTPQLAAGVIELHTIVAIIVYALLGWLLTKLVWLMAGENRRAITTSADAVRTETR
jgi:hypothetical protein